MRLEITEKDNRSTVRVKGTGKVMMHFLKSYDGHRKGANDLVSVHGVPIYISNEIAEIVKDAEENQNITIMNCYEVISEEIGRLTIKVKEGSDVDMRFLKDHQNFKVDEVHAISVNDMSAFVANDIAEVIENENVEVISHA